MAGFARGIQICKKILLLVQPSISGDFISFRIGIKENAECVGGINLFGEYFGNYKQAIEMIASLER
jgi:predicted transcriptional regulator